MATGNFSDRLLEAIERKRSHVVAGFDPDFALLPPALREKHEALDYEDDEEMRAAAYREFLLLVLENLQDVAVAVKIQEAYFEALGATGYELYLEMVRAARDLGYLVIADVKRGDIGSTAEAYARAHLDVAGADAVTVNPWFGSDGLEPFFKRCRDDGKGAFVLVKTSNPSSAEIQDLPLAGGDAVFEHVAKLVTKWGADTVGERGYQSIGVVVGGTHPAQVPKLRRLLPGVPFLVPGYGAQGAAADDVAAAFAQGTGAIVNSSRALLYAYRSRGGAGAEAAGAPLEDGTEAVSAARPDWLAATVAEGRAMKDALWKAAGRD